MAQKEKILFGVCNWLAGKMGFDTSLVRIAFVLFTLLGGAGIFGYFVIWIVKILGEKD